MKTSFKRVWALASTTYREIIRERLLLGVFVVAALLTGASFFLATISLDQNSRVMLNTGLASIHLLSLLISVFVATNSINRDFERRALYFLLPKPISRSEYAVGKYLGFLLFLLTTIAILGGLFSLGALMVNQAVLSPALINLAYSVMELSLLLAIATLFASFTAPLNAALYTLGIYFIGHSQTSLKLFVGELEQPVMNGIIKVVYYVLPNLEKFDVRKATLYQVPIPLAEVGWTVFYWLIYTGVIIFLATRVMRKQEV